MESEFRAKCREYAQDAPDYIVNQLKPPSASSQASSTKRRISIGGQPINHKVLAALCHALKSDSSVTILQLNDAFLGDEGAIAIASCLKVNNGIETLDLRGNNIRSDGTVALAQMLKVNTTLKSLLLEWNCVGIWETGVKSLADALTLNQTLELLDLRNCKVSSAGGQSLALALKHNCVLKRLDLRWNNLGIIGGRALSDGLKWNTALIEVELTGNEIPEDIVRSIATQIDRNKERYQVEKQSKLHSDYLSSTLQCLTNSHQAAINDLAAKLNDTDQKAVSLSEKLSIACKEISASQEAYAVAEAKAERLQKDLAKEKADFQRLLQEAHKEIAMEQDKRNKVEENLCKTNNSKIQVEANLREIEVKAEVLRRDKVMLLDEVEKLRQRIKDIEEHNQMKVDKLESAYKSKMAALEHTKEEESLEKVRKFEEKLRALSNEKAKVEEEFEAFKVKVFAEKHQLLNQISETEIRIRKDEELRRHEVEQQLDASKKAKEALQLDLASHMKMHSNFVRDNEAEIKRLNDQKGTLNEQYIEARTSANSLQSEVSKLKGKLEDSQKTERILEEQVLMLRNELQKTKEQMRTDAEKTAAGVAQKDGLISRLKEEIKRIEKELLEEREEQSIRMKDLTVQINTLLCQRRRHVRSHSLELALAQ
ncbi:hypothetical protein HDV05_008410 [Chytridiales sp. JEL 0842]|nr:hypothetical protein HDV05_008410 [Chytridiales sp. JEL 0842]